MLPVSECHVGFGRMIAHTYLSRNICTHACLVWWEDWFLEIWMLTELMLFSIFSFWSPDNIKFLQSCNSIYHSHNSWWSFPSSVEMFHKVKLFPPYHWLSADLFSGFPRLLIWGQPQYCIKHEFYHQIEYFSSVYLCGIINTSISIPLVTIIGWNSSIKH